MEDRTVIIIAFVVVGLVLLCLCLGVFFTLLTTGGFTAAAGLLGAGIGV